MNATTINTNVQATVKTLQYLTESTEGFFGLRSAFPVNDMISTLDDMSFSTGCLRVHTFGIPSGNGEDYFNNPSEALRVYALLPELIDSCIDCVLAFRETAHEMYGENGTAFKLSSQMFYVNHMIGTDDEYTQTMTEFCESKLDNIDERLKDAYHAAVRDRAEYEKRGLITPELLSGIDNPELTDESLILE